MQRKSKTTLLALITSIALLVLPLIFLLYYGKNVLSENKDKNIFLPSKTSDGHAQLENKCVLCHSPFNGVTEAACQECHEQELLLVKDSHPAKLFDDPRNADDLKSLNVLSCLTCHKEHLANSYLNEQTIAPDFCILCHQDVLQERPTHKNLASNGCRACHNYHDNTALYEDFLEKHLNEPDILDQPFLAKRNFISFYQKKTGKESVPLNRQDMDAPTQVKYKAAQDWLGSSHALAGVNCTACHSKQKGNWEDHPDQSSCTDCHEHETKGFLTGKHGQRLRLNLSPMTTAEARLAMQPEQKTVTCFSCHPAHQFDTEQAAVEACLKCHADQHSLAYKKSVHFQLWQEEQQGRRPPGAGVSCASCHLPRRAKNHLRNKYKKKRKKQRKGKKRKRKKKIEQVTIEHNQSANLDPNQKMIKTVCQNCHGLKIILDSLADKQLIQRNFFGSPGKHLKSLDMVKQRQK